MPEENKKIARATIIDRYLEERDIDGLYAYIQDKGAKEPTLCDMLEIWSMEKEREDRTIFWNVSSYDDALKKYRAMVQVLVMIVNKQELSEPTIEYAKREISVWAILIWIMQHLKGMRQILLFEVVSLFLREHDYDADKIRVLDNVYREKLNELLSEALLYQDGYLVKALLPRFPDKERGAELSEQAERQICQIEQKIQGRLYTPTNLEKTGEGLYFLVDCWHDRVLYSRNLCDIREWHTLDGNLQHPHSACWGEGMLAVESTGNNSVCFYRMDEPFLKLGEISLGKQPHRILYDDSRGMFWVLAGTSQDRGIF